MAASMDWSGQTFSQGFVEVEGEEAGEPIDPGSEYSVMCYAYFSGGWSMDASDSVEGTDKPPYGSDGGHFGPRGHGML